MKNNTTNFLMKECITKSLLLLLHEKPLDAISVLEIVGKAGVNRSTYYRHFQTKQAVIRYYYRCRLDACLQTASEACSLERYFTEIFTSFWQHKDELILLEDRSLSYLLLEEMNSRLSCAETDPVRLLYLNYHFGGVFNSFRYWLNSGMTIPPEVLARQCVAILPEDFTPSLYGQKTKS